MIAAFIQARIGSTRLPSKVLKMLGDKTVLEQVCARVSKSRFIDEVFVVTTIHPNNLPLIALCSSKGIRVFCGSEEDVLDRFYQLARLVSPEHIVRITSDCPVIDPEVVDLVIGRHLVSQADYTSNTIQETFPDGLDTEVFTFRALEKAWREATLQSEREHVTPFIKKHPDIFTLESVVSDTDLGGKRWTIDTEADYAFLTSVFDALQPVNAGFGMKEILALLESRPELESINSYIIRNEGYLKSLKDDKQVNNEQNG